MPRYHLGMDDTDSLQKGCTTYIGALLVDGLLRRGCRFFDYPNLIRLNPNIPWKSRGNAAVCLRFETELPAADIMQMAYSLVEKFRDSEDRKNQPGIALLEGDVPDAVLAFGRRALYEVLTVVEAEVVATGSKMGYRIIKGGRGLVGAVASIGNTLAEDHTYELVVYRGERLWGTKRDVDYQTVVGFDAGTKPYTFNNIDGETGRLLITPHGPDPILFGVRGETAEVVRRAVKEIRFRGGERWVLYRSNQGTAAHLTNQVPVSRLKAYQAAITQGTISKKPLVLKGSHVIGSLSDGSGTIDIASYEPSGGMRNVLRGLLPGDCVRAFGGVRVRKGKGFTFNLEKLEVLELVTEVAKNPVCQRCGISMKSEGKGKGYQCQRCGSKEPKPAKVRLDRQVSVGSYLPPPRSMRHLTKPQGRVGLEKSSWEGVVGSFYGAL
jgi:tRNA(Ile2)-agmatinylcytidine synthase